MITLSTADLVALARAQHVVLSPLQHPTPEAWMRGVVAALQELFGAERAVGSVGGARGVALVASGVGDQALAEYEADVAGADLAGEVVTGHTASFYVEEDFAAHSLFRAHQAGAAYNEWYRPHGLTRAVGMFALGDPAFVPDLYAGYDAPIVSNVLLAGTALSSGPGAERARAMLALLQPALAASVQTWQRVGAAAVQVGVTVDGLGAAAWVYDEAGRLLHESAAARGADAAVRATAGTLAASLLRGRRAGRPALPVQTAGAVLAGTFLRPGGPGDPALLVSVAAPSAALPSADVVQERAGLTRQQARVALLLAERQSTAEIAEALFISPHTVRRHTEQVLIRLGVARRERVAEALRAACAGGA